MKHSSIKNMQTFFLCAAFSLIGESCCATEKRDEFRTPYVPVDSVLRAELSDSLASVVLNPKTVTAQRLKVEKGEISIVESKRLNWPQVGIVCFQMATIEENDSATQVFGRFTPNVRYVFKSGKKRVWAEVDFGLGQLYFKTESGDVIKTYELRNKNLLKFSNVLFKDDEFLRFLLNQK